MLFNSLSYLVFFPTVVIVYFSLPFRFRNGWLLAASLVFYASWNPWFLLLVIASTSVDFLVARRAPLHRRYLWLALGTNVGILAAFKTLPVFGGPWAALLVPLGLSFHTFQAMSYVIDVYRGKAPAERDYPTYLLYILFFPQLVAGPIERSSSLLPQLRERHAFDYARLTGGLALVLWGIFKKVAVADRLAGFVDVAYADSASRSGLGLLFATVLFAFQIYYDFSGYSDIAVGSARVLGFDLVKNFDRPYASRSLGEFWRRWHISLSLWFRDYVYIPLGGNRVSAPRHALNLMVTFLLSGLWHGVSGTFLLWGAVHGALVVVFRRRGNVVTTFLAVALAFVLFRSRSLSQAVDIYRAMVITPNPALFFRELLGMGGLSLALFCLVVAEIGEKERHRILPSLRWAAYTALLWMTILFGSFQAKPFLYFVF